MFRPSFIGLLCLSLVNSAPQLGGILELLTGTNNGQNRQVDMSRLENQNVYNTPRGPPVYYNNNRQMPEYEVVAVVQPAPNRQPDVISPLPLSQKPSYQPQPPPEDRTYNAPNDYVAYENKFPRGLPPGQAKKQKGYGPPGHMPPGHNPNRGPPGLNRPPMGPKGPNKHGPPPMDQPGYRPPQDPNHGPPREPTYGYPEPHRPMDHPRPPQGEQYDIPPNGQRPPHRIPDKQETPQNPEDKDKLIQILTDIIGNRTTTSSPHVPNRFGEVKTTASPYVMSFQAVAVTPEE
ncbi:proline-rich protein HaeIII subfamily 1 [Plutella xylostella]|uniref:proline-rich protein HaeIII subfamily 1 n=1 Tax=Plutella xylostella TaxID=51655 RepID=UPI0020324ED5|nr:proline-rich protein HaeIII subfamily 1 [Plutella xylostella]